MKRTWTKHEVLSLITLFEQHEELWRLRSHKYKDRSERARSFKKLAKHFDTDVHEIYRKMHNLRTQFNHEFNKVKKRNGKGENWDSSWEFYTAMEFLSKNRSDKTVNNLDADEAKEMEFEEVEENSDNEIRKRIKTEEEIKYDFTIPVIEFSEGSKTNDATFETENLFNRTVNKSDDFSVFGNFVAAELKNLRSEDLQRELKLEIQRAILKYNELENTRFSN